MRARRGGTLFPFWGISLFALTWCLAAPFQEEGMFTAMAAYVGCIQCGRSRSMFDARSPCFFDAPVARSIVAIVSLRTGDHLALPARARAGTRALAAAPPPTVYSRAVRP